MMLADSEGTYIWNLRHHMSFYELLMIRVFIFQVCFPWMEGQNQGEKIRRHFHDQPDTSTVISKRFDSAFLDSQCG